MGIKSLAKFLKDTCPEVYEEIHISEYAYKKVAIDISLYLFVLKARHSNPDNRSAEKVGWLGDFIKFIECLRKYELHCVFIYDNPGAHHPDKEAERKERRASKEKLEKKVYDLEEAIDHFHQTNQVLPILIEFQEKKKLKAPKRLLSTKQNNTIDISSIEFYVKKLKKQLFTVTSADFDLTKQLFTILDVPFITAPLEAETMCADLCKRGLVDAVLSRDSDVMAYGAPVFLTNIDMRSGVCQRILYDNLLEELDLTTDQFLDFCIMCGTDYNKNIFRVGPKNAYKLIQKHGDIESIEAETKYDTEILNHVRGRELFRDYERANVNIGYCGSPKFDQLRLFLVKHNFFYSKDGKKRDELLNAYIAKLHKSFVHSVLVFEEEDDDDSELEIVIEYSDDEVATK
jgi:5'-3' exonuclease